LRWHTFGKRWCSIWKLSPPTYQVSKALSRAKSTVVSTWCADHSRSMRLVPGLGQGNDASSTTCASENTVARVRPRTTPP